MRALKALAGLFLLFLVSGCLVETEATLADPDPKSADARLVGTWYHAGSNEVTILAIAADPEQPGAYRVVFAAIQAGGKKPVAFVTYSAWRTVVNGRPYLNVRRTGGGAMEQPSLTIMSYDIGADGSLVLRLMDPKRVIAAIKAGQLKGTFTEGRYAEGAKIASSRAELAAFVAGVERDELFSQKTGALRKMAEMSN